jgi:Cd2+/Zn2+-exporting ATPase
MMTGDNESVAQVIGHQVGIDEIQAECLPEEKAEYVRQLRREGQTVAVVGDGVNDAPALAAGDIGIAMGAIGSDIAVNSASVALMSNDLRRIPFLVALSRKTRKIMNVNLVFGALFIVGGLMFFIFGDHLLNSIAGALKLGDPAVMKAFLAATIHIVSTFVVLFNSARLVRFGETLA